MKIAELLKNFMVDNKNYQDHIVNRPNLEIQTPETEDKTDTKTMVAPLQQKLELLKKAVDVDSYYDDGQENKKLTSPIQITLNIPNGESDTNINLTLNGTEVDELDEIKRIAGIPTATIFDAGDEEPLDV